MGPRRAGSQPVNQSARYALHSQKPISRLPDFGSPLPDLQTPQTPASATDPDTLSLVMFDCQRTIDGRGIDDTTGGDDFILSNGNKQTSGRTWVLTEQKIQPIQLAAAPQKLIMQKIHGRRMSCEAEL
ncbi:hypothetical protein RRG08_034940 [Elysia crispata]|uniref:Uncharacterized protein n=1 Tax=Elysia crispata TaxID=231223 RepID=A0AAE0Y210_9GAST|nr:hypothetical protein RRG08_034940 [Elysia crispata]